MKTKLLGLIACMALLGSTVAATASPYVVTLEEVGSNVVATGSGAIDTTGLTLAPFTDFESPGMDPGGTSQQPSIITGAGGFLAVYEYVGQLPGPSSFGSGSITQAGFSPLPSGDNVGINASRISSFDLIFVPVGYVSGTALSDSATYDLATFASLGVTPGTYTWTWGTIDAEQSFTIQVGTAATPLPAALPLFATGIGGLGLLGWRRKRKNAAALAAA